ncbi:hypothetical protein ASPTUDRAFT_54761 [Aspergillus tubingensis CBS 134.48]|uniref:Uncharacterized protein n=1 Tax=Aspergillus tubingensis (strain CBS 134.48) TaxID=767770 RepID=A0A1L9N711_ASPTC|nr:hypothetical protein ASPTUDRAFT_54761 [Aspergillus tubingensis CBS 134.48]
MASMWQDARGLLSKINANLNYTSACGPAVCSVLLVDCSCVLSIAPSTMLDPLSVPVPGILASATFLQKGKESQEATVRLGPAQKGGRRGEGPMQEHRMSKSKHTEGIHTEHSTPFEKPAIDACRIGSERQSIVAIPFDGWRFHNTLFAFIQFVVCHPGSA